MRTTLAVFLLGGLAAAVAIFWFSAQSTVPPTRPDSHSTPGSPSNTDDPGHDAQASGIITAAEAKRITVENQVDPILKDVSDSQLDHGGLEEFIAKRHIGAYRIVDVNSDALRTQIRQAGEHGSLDLQLLNDRPITLTARDATEHSTGWQTGIGTWIGAVEGDDTSYVTFVVAPDGSVNGVVRSQVTGRVKIEPITGTPYHIVWQLGEGFERKLD